jgi:hypothetical protein
VGVLLHATHLATTRMAEGMCTHTQLANKEERLSSVVGQPNNKMGPFHFTGAKQFQCFVIFPPLSFLNHFHAFCLFAD